MSTQPTPTPATTEAPAAAPAAAAGGRKTPKLTGTYSGREVLIIRIGGTNTRILEMADKDDPTKGFLVPSIEVKVNVPQAQGQPPVAMSVADYVSNNHTKRATKATTPAAVTTPAQQPTAPQQPAAPPQQPTAAAQNAPQPERQEEGQQGETEQEHPDAPTHPIAQPETQQ